MNGVSKTQLAIQQIQEASATQPDRHLDMQLAVYLPDSKRPVFRVGGRWDTRDRCYSGPAETESAIHLTPAQAGGWESVVLWLRLYVDARGRLARGEVETIDQALHAAWGELSPLFTLQLYGGRQGGKTHLAAVAVALLCIAVPGARAAVVSTTADKSTEIEDIFELYCFPSNWRAAITSDGELRLANGSLIAFRSGRVTDLKAFGPTEIAILNEAQEQKQVNWTDLQGNTLARAGLVVIAQNPPRRNIGEWTQALYEAVKAGRQPGTRSHWIDPALNQFTSNMAMEHMASTMSARAMRRDVRGDMGVPVGDIALHEWSDSDHVIEWIPTTWQDVTAEVTPQMFDGISYAQVGGLDWDKGAGPSYSLGRIFRPHNAPAYELILVIEHGQRFEGLPEQKFAAHLLALQDRYNRPLAHPASTIWVGDSSGRTQSSLREFDEDDHPSWQRMLKHGWQVTFVDPVQKRNPKRSSRFALINDYVLQRQATCKQPRVVMLADTARHVIKASRMLPRHKMEASTRDKHAHLVDGWTYPAWRLFSVEYRDFVNAVPEVVARNVPRSNL